MKPLAASGVTFAARLLALPAPSHAISPAFRENGSFVYAFGSAGSGSGQFNNAAALDVSAFNALLYVLDKDNARVEVFEAFASPARRSSWGAIKRLYR